MEESRGEHDGLPYLLWMPDSDPRGLIVFLHGIGERAEEMPLKDVPVHSLPFLAREGSLPEVGGGPFPFLVACPQTDHQSWGPDAERVAALAGALGQARRYVTGISMGAYGSWLAALAGPDTFGALVPVSGGVPREAHEVTAPVWMFAGRDDDRAPLAEIEKDLAAADPRGPVRFEKVDGGTHSGDFWNLLYGRTDIYEWLLE